jgi:hypothetical protein
MDRPDSFYDFICTICNQTFNQLPRDALEISRAPNSRITMYQFGDTQHAIKKVRKKAATAEEQK